MTTQGTVKSSGLSDAVAFVAGDELIIGRGDKFYRLTFDQAFGAANITFDDGNSPAVYSTVQDALAAAVAAIISSASDVSFDDGSSPPVYTNVQDALAAALAGAGGSGDVTGPGSSTDNAAARFDGTGGKTLQDSSLLIDDSGNISSFGGQIAFPATQNPSSDANTLDDYEEGTWTPTWGGFSSDPTSGAARYEKVGRIVKASLNGWNSGTSNATTKTITLPFTAGAADVMAGVGHPLDNGAFSNNPCRFDTRSASAVCDVYKNLNADNWTASGSCVFDFTIIYRASA